MNHLPPVVSDLTLILSVAGGVTLVCRLLKQPVVLGYLLSGLLIGTLFQNKISDPASVKVWADLGVVFLLFGMGLEFSFKRLLQVGGTAALIAVTEVGAVFLFAFSVTRIFLGWTTLESLFAGGVFCISSTAIIARTIEEFKFQNRRSSKLVFGVIVLEDLVAVLLLVVFTTFSATEKFKGEALFDAIFRLGFFLTFWFTFGIFLIPTFLKSVRSHLNSEMLLVVGLSLCLAMAWIATEAGFSPALGAFVMGSLIAETKERDRIAALSKPVRQLFAAIFFVSVGMLIDPEVVQREWRLILIFTSLVLIVKPSASFLAALASGQGLRTSLQTGLTLSQIGEFSFIIAALGMGLGGKMEELYPIAIVVSAITTFTTTHLIGSSEKFHGLLDRALPRGLKESLSRYQAQLQVVSNEKEWQPIFLKMIVYVLMNLSIILGIGWFGRKWLRVRLIQMIDPNSLALLLGLGICLLLAGPFLWALAFGGIRSKIITAWRDARQYRFAFFGIQVVRISLALLMLGYLVSQFIPLRWGVGILLVTLASIALLLSRKMEVTYNWFQNRFQENWKDEPRENDHAEKLMKRIPFEMSLSKVTIDPNFRQNGKTLAALSVREKYGISVVGIQRGDRRIIAPSREDQVMPGDILSVIGLENSIEKFESYLREDRFTAEEDLKARRGSSSMRTREIDLGALGESEGDARVFPVRIHDDSPALGKTIAQADIRGVYGGIVIGIERGGSPLLHPASTLILQRDDLLWLMG